MTLPDTLLADLEADDAAADQRAHTDEARCTCGDIHGPWETPCWVYEDSPNYLDDDRGYERAQDQGGDD